MNDKRWLVWGLAAACGAAVVWKLWPELTRGATPRLRPPRRFPNLLPPVETPLPEPRVAVPVKVPAKTVVPPPETSPAEEPAVASENARVRLNSSSLLELQTLPGVGPTLAGRIVAARPFGRVEDLLGVAGVGPSLVSKVSLLVEL